MSNQRDGRRSANLQSWVNTYSPSDHWCHKSKLQSDVLEIYHTKLVYTEFVKNITISVDDDLWTRVKHAAADEHISMNAFIQSLLANSVKRNTVSPTAKLIALSEESTQKGAAWKWSRDEIYEDAI